MEPSRPEIDRPYVFIGAGRVGLLGEVLGVEARDGHNWENWRDRLREGLAWLFPGPLGFLATIAFLVGNLILLWLYMLAPMRRRWHDLVPYTLTAPVYWVLQSVAGYRAAWQFITRPHYWEKTEHGEGVRLEDIAERDLKAAS